MFYDYHIHSNFSADCKVDMEYTIKQAIQVGLKEICFTDHVDYEYTDGTISFEIDYKKYFEKLHLLSQKYENKISIKKGLEMGLQPHIVKKCSKDINSYPFDFVICSMHTADKKDLYNGDIFKEISQKQGYEKYYLDLLKVVENFDNYSVLGHLDIIRRYGNFERPLDNSFFMPFIEEILKKVIQKGKGIEINTSGFRYHLNDFSPTVDVLKRYKELGGEIITTGSDSHVPETLAYKFDYVYDILNSLGFRYIAIFKDSKPQFIKIHK